MSEGMADIPEESNVDTESDGAALGDYEDLSDGDHDKDEDYDDTQALNKSESEEEQEANQAVKTPGKSKKKVTVGAVKSKFIKKRLTLFRKSHVEFSATRSLLLVKNPLSMELQVHQSAQHHLEESERKLHQLVSLGMLPLVFARCIKITLLFFFQYSNNVNDKRAKRAEPSGLLAGWKQSLAKERANTIKGE
jgi:hypothetical protein